MTDKNNVNAGIICNAISDNRLPVNHKYAWLECGIGDGIVIEKISAMYGANSRYKGRMRFRSTHDKKGRLLAIRVE